MKVLVLGAAGMIGCKLTERLVRDGEVGGKKIAHLALADIVQAPAPPASFPIASGVFDLSRRGTAEELIADRPELIFHLAAIVSGEAEADLEKGYRINFDGTRDLFEAIRRVDDYVPRVVFTSSLAVYGAPFPGVIPDDFHLTPLTSYGTQKAMGELILSDYSRRGFLDGVGIRLPTICVRPGKPNRAASGFFSGIIREPLNGQKAVLPVPPTVRHWFASPRAAIGFLIQAAGLDASRLGAKRNLTMPGLSATVEEQIEALRDVAGNEAVALIETQPDPAIAAIVGGWPEAFEAGRARDLGFRGDASFAEIIEIYRRDDMPGARASEAAGMAS
ncbi:D-erythronate dehydrogenase [Bosea sp. (in: a-proteobacteria)]|uniref:D-erythronate dehydrogenase n=1 Tax=Bosea sp. (in: a-proteobacteria) TaxID=1871050 RepID=UPI00260FF006|nr:D-erythronate dehydrogenase [Bosea sp. (in: a-proteobacteria)]MCO5090352.1 SDR family oxidoreductase [Bosea sp. (in: a-proteobacteria)]